MSHKIVLRMCFSVLLLGAGTSGAEELNGILGKSVTFQVKTSPPLESISWSKIANTKSELIALVTFGKSCGLQVPDPAYQKRVNISEDCRELHLSHLKKEDAGRFTAGIIQTGAEKVDESFDLQIFRQLLASDLRVICTPDGNGTWQLNCSKEPWEVKVNFSWTSSAKSTGPTPGSSVFILQDLDPNITCTAKNLVSNASKTVSSKEVCAEERPGMEAPQDNGNELPKNKAWIGGVIAAVIFCLLLIFIVVYVRKRKAAKGSGRFTTHSEIENPSRSDSTLIGNQPKETRRKTNQPSRRAANNNQEMPHTIYSAVQHPKQNPLQTDDEKIQKGRRSHQNQEEKTIYSEITKSQESEDPSIKTIYETVQKPLSVKSSGL